MQEFLLLLVSLVMVWWWRCINFVQCGTFVSAALDCFWVAGVGGQHRRACFFASLDPVLCFFASFVVVSRAATFSGRQLSAPPGPIFFPLGTEQLHNKMEDLKGKIRVYVRVRPFSTKEKARGCTEAVTGQGKTTIAVQDPRVKEEKTFDFDQVNS